MKVFYDGSIFSLQKNGGISCYWVEYLKYFATTPESPLTLSLSLYPGYENNMALKPHLETLAKRVVIAEKNTLQMMTDLSFGGAGQVAKKVDIFHSPYFNLPPQKRGRCNILSVNDLLYLDQKEKNSRYYARRFLQNRSIERANRFVAISHVTKSELLRCFPSIEPTAVQVIHLAASEIFSAPPATLSPQCTFSAPDFSYLLYVGGRSGYKNFVRFVEAFADTKSDLQVICIGGGAFDQLERDTLVRLGVLDKFMQFTGVSDRELAYLYSRAVALVYPSQREGFGIPILEAMAAGCPVMCLAQSSMKEIAGEAALFLEDEECANLAKTLGRAQGSEREQIVQAGQLRASEFSWRKSAEQLFNFYEGVGREF